MTATRVAALLSAADTRWDTARGVGRHWQDLGLVERAFHQHFEGSAGDGSTATVTAHGGPDVLQVETVLALAVDRRRRRWRSELLSWSGQQPRADLVVTDADTFWARSGRDVLTNAGDPNHGHGGAEMADLLQPGVVPMLFDLEAAGPEQIVAGRRCLPAIARRRLDVSAAVASESDPFGMITGGRVFHLSVDVDTGVLVRAVKVVDDQPAEVCEFTSLVLDEPLPDDLFQPIAPAGGRLIDTHPVPRRTT